MNSKKLLIISFILLIVLAVTYFTKVEKHETNKTPQNNLNKSEEKIKKLTNVLMEKGITEKQMKELIGGNIDTYYVAIGPLSYLNEKSSSQGIDLKEYEKAQSKYANRLEEKIKKNFEYKITNSVKSVEGNNVVSITFKSYYYSVYLDDLNMLAGYILEMKGYSPKTDFLGKETNESKADIFKAKVKAMEILDLHLDAYYNNHEYANMDIVIYDKQEDNLEAITTYVQNLAGTSYPKKFDEVGTSNYEEKQKNRIGNYINESINNSTLIKQNPLQLK